MTRASKTSLAAAGAAGLYLVGTKVGLLLTPHDQPVSLLWPPNALLLAMLLLSPQRSWKWYALAILPVHFGIQLLNDIPFSTSVGWYFTNVGESMLAAFCLRRVSPTRELFRSLYGLALFLLVSVVGVTGLTSFLDAAVLIATGTGETYWGKHGLSRRLHGLDPENSLAAERGIVVHAASYVDAAMALGQGRIGRSQGCFAVSTSDIGLLLSQLGSGRLLFAWK